MRGGQAQWIIPIVVYEYKPRVPSNLSDVNPMYFSELLLQAYYLKQYYSNPVVHCLTDLHSFHYFYVEESSSSMCMITKYSSCEVEIGNPDDLAKHISIYGVE